MHQNPFRYWTPKKYKENERAYLWTIIVTGNDTYPHPLSIHQSMLFFSTNCAISLKVCTVYISKVSISYGVRTCSTGYFTSSFFIKSYFLYLSVIRKPFQITVYFNFCGSWWKTYSKQFSAVKKCSFKSYFSLIIHFFPKNKWKFTSWNTVTL